MIAMTEPDMKVLSPLTAVRKNCLDCSGGSSQQVKFCPCDSVHSTRCHLWPYRFGKRPGTASSKYTEEFVTPGALPPPDVMLEECEKAVVA